MSTALKVGLSGLGIVVTAGGGLIGSNYAFDKTIHVNLEQNADEKEWDKKLEVLLKKMETNPKITEKIDNNSETFALQDNNKKEFKDKSKAREALRGWCEQSIVLKQVEAKDDEDLCKLPKQAGWLFGNQRK